MAHFDRSVEALQDEKIGPLSVLLHSVIAQPGDLACAASAVATQEPTLSYFVSIERVSPAGPALIQLIRERICVSEDNGGA